ncbi:OmpA family protein [Draconibacterium sp. IB214405]|uniref:PorE family type IX secretion system protein n=1 Tax=Draconibacterium sp. IB214405 TaxID=3097352 RepID=UPI002A17A15B|nr:OmpA family protein [Draconibacterium sp. IB214405]MDX8340872.1 OmpA family protein [Draconibacterium sp. IB214405]
MKQVKLAVFFIIIVVLSGCGSAKHGRDALLSQDIGEYYKAIEKYRKARKKEKNRQKRIEYAYNLAECYRAIGMYDYAEQNYKFAIRLGYDNPEALLHYAEMLRITQDYEEAYETYRTYLDSVPGDERALDGVEAMRKTQEWVANPTRHIINPIKELNSRESDFAPVFVGGRDNEIFFTSSRKAATGKKESMITGHKYTDIFRATFGVQRQKWEQPKLLDENMIINTGEEEGAITLNSTGEQMIFTRCRYDKSQPLGAELYSTSQSRGSWSGPIKLQIVGDSIIAAHPALSPDGTEIYFVSDMRGGQGGKDIWKATMEGGSFGKPVNMGPIINTAGDEMFPFVRDNGELYFASNGHIGQGGLDIFMANKNEDGIWVVENMGSPMNSPSDDFGIAFVTGEDKGMFTSNRKGSRGDDIYSFVVPPKVYEIEIEVFDKETASHLDGSTMRIIGTDGTNLKVRARGGKFKMKLKPETEYVFAAFKDGYLRDKAAVNTIGLADSKDFRFDMFLTATDAPIKVDNISYEFGSWELLESSKVALDTLVQILVFNPTITIELMAHTDYVGSDQFNFDLSQKRAQSVVDYLIEKGINPDRLVAKGYGETWPKTVNRKLANQYDFLKRGDELTEEFILTLPEAQQEIAQSINRRTEFRVLSTDFIEKFDAEPER